MSISTKRLTNFIDGEPCAPEEQRYQPVLDPATEQVIAEVPRSTAQDVARAAAAAHSAYRSWAETPASERANALLHLADAIESNGELLAQLESLDVGKPIDSAREEIPFIVDNLRFFAGAARSLQGPAAAEYVPGFTSMMRREPLGVCALIAPWNYPLMMAVWKLGPAIAVGNTAVLKPAEQTPLTTAKLVELAAEHLPAGVLNLVLGRGSEIGEALLAEPDIDMVALTGSTQTGKQVAQAAAKTLKRVHLELGGKAPVIVFADADLDKVREGLRFASFTNAGQDCTAATRVLVQSKAHDAVVGELGQAAESLRIGSPAEEQTELGPLVSAAQRDRVSTMIERRPSSSELVTGGRQPPGDGFFLEPTVIAGLEPGCELVTDEVFGPVVTVQSFDDQAQAVAMANDVRYGLSASVWTRDGGRALDVARQLNCGVVWVNTHMVLGSEMPHGGRRDTGYGSDLSLFSLEDFTAPKHVMVRLPARA